MMDFWVKQIRQLWGGWENDKTKYKRRKKMVFSEETVKEAWDRAGGKCECQRTTHGHTGRCNKTLTWENRGRESGVGAWETHHKVSVESGGADTLSNCEILCWNCHKTTF